MSWGWGLRGVIARLGVSSVRHPARALGRRNCRTADAPAAFPNETVHKVRKHRTAQRPQCGERPHTSPLQAESFLQINPPGTGLAHFQNEVWSHNNTSSDEDRNRHDAPPRPPRSARRAYKILP